MAFTPFPADAPVGCMKPWGGNEATGAPSGWLFCDGSAVSQTTYSDLFSVIGVTYGDPGGGNFSLPDFRGKSLQGVNNSDLPAGEDAGYSQRNRGDVGGEESHSLTVAEGPAHSHTVPAGFAGSSSTPVSRGTGTVFANPSTSGSGSGTAHNTMHPFTVANVIIRAA